MLSHLVDGPAASSDASVLHPVERIDWIASGSALNLGRALSLIRVSSYRLGLATECKVQPRDDLARLCSNIGL